MSAPAYQHRYPAASSAGYGADYSADFGAAEPEFDPADHFDDSDGAYAVAEPNPFETQPVPSGRGSLRVELGSAPAGPASDLLRPALTPLAVRPELAGVLPDGLRRGGTIAVANSVSLLLALLGTASGQGAWTALVGMPTISAEAAAEAGLDLARLAIISPSGSAGWTGSSWTTAVGALLDAVDVVVARPAAIGGGRPVSDGDARRLTARARTKDAVLVLFGQAGSSWPATSLTLTAQHDCWTGIGEGYGRLVRRKMQVNATGRGRSARPRSAELWL